MSWAKSEFALASRTNKGQWAFNLLTKFEVDETGMTMDDLFRYKEIYTGSKRKVRPIEDFRALHETWTCTNRVVDCPEVHRSVENGCRPGASRPCVLNSHHQAVNCPHLWTPDSELRPCCL